MQKNLLPKLGSETMTTASRPTLQTMIKSAQAGALSRAQIANEASRQLGELDKVAEATCRTCKKPIGECKCSKKEGHISTSYALKTAEALEFLAEELGKEAAANMPPAHITENKVEPGKGPGALEVSHATASTPLPDHKGQGHHIVPMHSGEEKVRPSDQAANALETNESHRAGGNAKTPERTVGKTASRDLVTANLTALPKLLGKTAGVKVASELENANRARLGLPKLAEDAINPARISAGPAVAPEASASGQAGGEPVGGKPQGTKGVGSNEESISLTRGQAKADPKSDLRKWFNEPALTSSTDNTLNVAFDNTGKAGVKISSDQTQVDNEVKTASARALIENLLESAVPTSRRA